MGAFEYIALDNAGKERKGVLEGDTPRHIRQLLRERQLLPVTVNEVAQKEANRQRSFSFVRRVAPADLSLFTRQLATLVRAGLPLEESLLAVSQQTEKPRVQSIILGVRSKVMEGHTLADGLTEFPRVFPEIYRATIAAGEQAGHLDNVLERLAEYTESREEIRQKILAAMLYPIVLTVMCFVIVSALLVFVVPKVVSVFEASKAQLPLITRVLIATSGFLKSYGIYAAHPRRHRGGALPALAAQPRRRRRYHRLQLRLPLIGKLARGFNTARFTRTFSILSASVRAGARSHAHRGRGGDEPADARCGRGCRRAGARGRAHRPLARREQALPAHDGPPHLERRVERRARFHAGAGRHEPGAGARWHPGGHGGPPRAPAHRGHGPVRHGHRVCHAAADLSDE